VVDARLKSDGGGPAGVFDTFEAAKKEGCSFCLARASGVDGGLDAKGTVNMVNAAYRGTPAVVRLDIRIDQAAVGV